MVDRLGGVFSGGRHREAVNTKCSLAVPARPKVFTTGGVREPQRGRSEGFIEPYGVVVTSPLSGTVPRPAASTAARFDFLDGVR